MATRRCPARFSAGPTEESAYVATTDTQRRAWSLPDLTAAGREDDGAAIAVMAPCDAIRTLLGSDAHGPDSRPEGAVPPARAEAADGGAQRSVTDIVNLKEDRGRIPSGSRQAFAELSGATQLDAARGKLGAAIELLERKTLPALERSQHTIETLSEWPISRQRLSAACDTDPLLDPDERLAAVCWAVRRRFDRAEQALAPLTASALSDVEPKPTDVGRSLRACDADEIDTKRLDEVIEQLGAALPAWGCAVSRVIDRLCRLAVVRRGLHNGGWDDTALGTLRSLVRDIEAVRGSLEGTEALDDDLAAARSDIEVVEKHWKTAGSLEAETRELLGRIEAADLPVCVLDEALHEVRRSLTATYETAATMLDRVRLLIGLPWARRAPERVELARAMSGLDASHAGCRRIKDRIRRFLAVHTLHTTAWTVEACGGGELGGDSRGPAALVVRQPRPAAPSPILCFIGPPGCGKTSLAKVIGEALGRPCVSVPLGGVWDEAHIRGLPPSFRSPEPGLIVRGLSEAKVRNPVVILDEIDKVSRRTSNVGNPSAALLELLDPAQNTAFVDRYAGVPVDLSEVMWIGTANNLAAMPPPLRDRMDVIEVPGYTDEEKVAIVRRHLDRIIEDSGLAVERLWTGGSGVTPRERRDAGHDGATARPTLLVKATDSAAPAPSLPVEITDAAIRAVIRGHTCESGVRHLLRLVGAVCEEVACRRVTTGDASPVLIVAHDGERPDAPASSRLRVDEVLGPASHETVPDAVRDVVAREQERVMALPRADPEAARAFDWIEVATDLPWNRRAARVDAPAVKPALDRAHVGCEQQKQRLLDHLAAGGADTGSAAADTLPCLTGPAGTGKTALARSLAASLGRGFVEVSLAGVREAAAIRGIARPRPDAASGCLVTGLRQRGVSAERKTADPVIVLDRLDQLAEGPAADALLDALDPDPTTCFATTTSDYRSTCRQ